MPGGYGTDAQKTFPTAAAPSYDGAMTSTSLLEDRLRLVRADEEPDWIELYDSLVAKLRRDDIGASAPPPGGLFPDFVLPDLNGVTRRLGDILARGPVVLSFNRGTWCPYCTAEITAWAECRDRLDAAGADLLVISAEVNGGAQWIADLTGRPDRVLCDVDQGLALALGLAFHCTDPLRRALLAEGIDFAQIYGNAGWNLPVPATFALDRGGRVRFAHVEADFRRRAEPRDVLAALNDIAPAGR